MPSLAEDALWPTRLPDEKGNQRRGSFAARRLALVLLTLTAIASPIRADEYEDAVAAFQHGKYEEALAAAEEATAQPFGDHANWWQLRLQCLVTLGKHRDGSDVLKKALERHVDNAGLHVIGWSVKRGQGKPDEARKLLQTLLRTASNLSWRYQSASDRVWLGRAANLLGSDAREVLEKFYDEARRLNPELREVYAATGELALEKHDDRVAADTFREALEKFPNDADFLCGLARATSEAADDDGRTLLKQAIEVNPRHLPSLLATADDALAHESFDEARAALDQIHAIDATHPVAWSMRAVLAHLQADKKAEEECRKKALATWKKNPEVPFTIGAHLSRAYRFAEGAAYQREALKVDREYLPARTQLAQDLLRLGEADEGWKLIHDVQEKDGYNVVAYNLANLHERIAAYVTLESEHFRLLMDRREAAVYGDRVLALLERACDTLGEKYQWRPKERVTVEILTNQKDFAVRTFGLPGGDGILGVCFGKVITVNSPAALPSNPTNWQATVWHEYCHVVTLELTRHRIPRWLSEGISVYEERQADRTWGNRLSRQTRQMILDGELTPVSHLNEAFRNSRSPAHFNLAYYEASLVVEFLVERFGHQTLRDVLSDVAGGMPINMSLARRTGSLEKFDDEFDAFARKTATAFGPEVDWSDEIAPPKAEASSDEIAAWVKEHPKHYLGRVRLAQALLRERKPDEAATVLERLINDVPDWSGDDSPYALLAKVRREQDDAAAEQRVLEDLADRSDDALSAYRRLMELASAADDTSALAKNFERYIAVQPLEEWPYRQVAESATDRTVDKDKLPIAVGAARALIALGPVDKSGAHFLLARLLQKQQSPEAKRQALMALEETPRFRAAQRLLLEIVDDQERKP